MPRVVNCRFMWGIMHVSVSQYLRMGFSCFRLSDNPVVAYSAVKSWVGAAGLSFAVLICSIGASDRQVCILWETTDWTSFGICLRDQNKQIFDWVLLVCEVHMLWAIGVAHMPFCMAFCEKRVRLVHDDAELIAWDRKLPLSATGIIRYHDLFDRIRWN